MHRIVGLVSLVGFVACFLPFMWGSSISVFDLTHFTWRAWATVAAFAVPAYFGLRLDATATLGAAAIGYGYLAFRLGPKAIDFLLHGGLGGKLIGLSIIGGVISTVALALERREDR